MTPRTFFLALGLLVTTSSVAHASPNFPDAVRDYIGATGPAPACTLCHSSNLGGPGTVTTPFGRATLSHGAAGKNDSAQLLRALAELDADQTDSDCDGVPDLDELRAGSDPNQGPCQGPPSAQTGCGLGRAGERYDASWPALAVLAALLGIRRKRARH